MPEPRPPPRMRLRHAALAAAAALAVLWPLGQVLHFHGDELQALQAERAALDPLTLAVQVQRGLLGHELVTARVLAGRLALEPERRLRQAEVDGAIWRLKGTLSAGLWTLAQRETQHLEQDWRQLARRATLRQLAAAESTTSHRLLVEQALQVMDLVSAAAPRPAPWLAPVMAGAVLPAPKDEATARAQLATLSWLHLRLEAQTLLLDERLRQSHTARRQLATALGLLAVLCLLGAWRLWGAVRRPHAGAEHAADTADSVRRGYGRRTTDTAPRADETQRLIRSLRQGETSWAVVPPEPPP